MLGNVIACLPAPHHYSRLALEGSVRHERRLPSWTLIPLAILAFGVLLSLIRFLSSEPVRTEQIAAVSQVARPTQEKLSAALEQSTPQRLFKPVIPEAMFIDAYVVANIHDPDLDGYAAAKIAEVAGVEFSTRFQTCGPTLVCGFDTSSMNSRGMRAIRLIEAAARSARVNQP